MARHKESDNLVCQNRKAHHHYEILESLECGIVLLGTEVKSLRDKTMSIEEAYVRLDSGALWLIGCHIGAYRFGTTAAHDPLRKRKLLAHSREIRKIKTKGHDAGAAESVLQ